MFINRLPGSDFVSGSGSDDGSAPGTARLVLICLFDKLACKLGRSLCGSTSRLVLLNNRGLNGCGRAGAAVVEDGGSVAGSVVGSIWK